MLGFDIIGILQIVRTFVPLKIHMRSWTDVQTNVRRLHQTSPRPSKALHCLAFPAQEQQDITKVIVIKAQV